jgi:O-antigen ligase
MAIYIIREKIPLNHLEKTLSTILGVGLVMSILLTKSSGGLIVLAAFSASVFLVSRNASFIFKVLFVAFVMLAVFFLGEAVQLTMEKFSEVDLGLIQQRAESLKFGGYGSLSWRLGYWLAIYNAFIASDLSSIMHGFGTGVMSQGNYIYFFMDKDPHNDFLLLFVENGAVGLASILLVLLNLVRKMEFRWLIGFALFLPMFWGNIISSFPVFSAYILMLSFYKKKHN